MSSDDSGGTSPTRRDALKRGVVLGGAAIWAVPALQVVSLSARASVQPSDPLPPPTDTSPPPSGKIPSHAIILVNKGTYRFGLKIDVSKRNYFGKIASPADRRFLRSKGYVTYNNDPDSQAWKHVSAALHGYAAPGRDVRGERAIVLTLPPGYTLVAGYSFDGALQDCAAGKYQVHFGTGPFLFYGDCHA